MGGERGAGGRGWQAGLLEGMLEEGTGMSASSQVERFG